MGYLVALGALLVVWAVITFYFQLSKNQALATFCVLTLFFFMGWWVKPYFIGTWTEPARVVSAQGEAGEGNYVVFVEYTDGSKESLKNTDIWWRFKLNSTDVQAEMKGAENKDKMFRFKVLGRRIYLWSSYRNITKYEQEK